MLLLSACSAVASPATTPVPTPSGQAVSSSGVCEAILALPDETAASRAFTDLAHDALHDLAGDPRLSRAMSAPVLEAMEKVESAFRGSPDVTVLSDDLVELHVATDAALVTLGVAVPRCAA